MGAVGALGVVVPKPGGVTFGATIGGTVSTGPVSSVCAGVVGTGRSCVLVRFCVRTTVSIWVVTPVGLLVLPTATPKIAPAAPPTRTPKRAIESCWRAGSTP